MKLYEIAKQYGAETVELKQLLGVESHLIELTEAQINQIRNKYNVDKKKDNKTIRFVSEIWKHCIAQGVPGVNEPDIRFKDFAYVCDKDSPEVQSIRSVMIQTGSIHEVADEPFEDEVLRAQMSEYLEGKAFSDNFPTVRGLTFLRAHFSPEEIADLKVNKRNTRVLILRILESKSYAEWRKTK